MFANQVWDAALRAVCQAWGVRSCPPFVQLMQIAVAGLARKPVRARCRTLISNSISSRYHLSSSRSQSQAPASLSQEQTRLRASAHYGSSGAAAAHVGTVPCVCRVTLAIFTY